MSLILRVPDDTLSGNLRRKLTAEVCALGQTAAVYEPTDCALGAWKAVLVSLTTTAFFPALSKCLRLRADTQLIRRMQSSFYLAGTKVCS